MKPSPADPEALARLLEREALELGFDLVGIAPAVEPPGYPRFLEWLASGRLGSMEYLRAQAPARRHPASILTDCRSVVMVARSYAPTADPLPPGTTTGSIARFAQGEDYHELLWRRLERLGAWLEAKAPGVRTRAIADSAPLMERDFAVLAGIGWIGKNTMLIHKRMGSYLVLGALLTDADLAPGLPHLASHCGTCTACLEACPTGAFVGPGQLDARRCISTWTIEHRGPLPDPARSSLNGWVFGCDICQEVCPWNRKAPPGRDPALQPRSEWTRPDLLRWFEWSPEEFRSRLRGTALKRAKRAGLLRNAAAVLAESGAIEAIPVLERAARRPEEDPIVLDAILEALARLGGQDTMPGSEPARA